MLSKAKLKYIQTLGQKKHRDEEGVFIAEGTKIVSELIESSPSQVLEVFALPEWLDENKKITAKINTIEADMASLERISQLATPSKVLALVKKFDPASSVIVKGKITLALDTIQDPGNLGTIIRIADWFGIGSVICSDDCADIYNPKTVQSTMGSIARVPVLYTDLLSWIKEQEGVRIYATVLEGQDITTVTKIREGIILIGNESKGIQSEILQLANVKLTIPRRGKAESLNAAVATGIVLSHIV